MTAPDLSGAVERESAAWFRDQAGKLGCDNWRGPARLEQAANRIEQLEAALSERDAEVARANNIAERCLARDDMLMLKIAAAEAALSEAREAAEKAFTLIGNYFDDDDYNANKKLREVWAILESARLNERKPSISAQPVD